MWEIRTTWYLCSHKIYFISFYIVSKFAWLSCSGRTGCIKSTSVLKVICFIFKEIKIWQAKLSWFEASGFVDNPWEKQPWYLCFLVFSEAAVKQNYTYKNRHCHHKCGCFYNSGRPSEPPLITSQLHLNFSDLTLAPVKCLRTTRNSL